ncbi:MAG: DUF4372 domain-containing protein [Opitutaceae bacterium]
MFAKYSGDYKTSALSSWDHLLALSFALLTFRESLRDIESVAQVAWAPSRCVRQRTRKVPARYRARRRCDASSAPLTFHRCNRAGAK